MAHHPMWRPDSAKPVPSDPVAHEPAPEAEAYPSSFSGSEYSAAKRESDFDDLAAKLAAHGDGKIPRELSGELALDIVLNEIVEEACLATGASGAAIALARGEEMVCRATSGGDAPELGTRLDMNAGLSGACVRTRQIQSCDDALADPSADAEVSRELGVRSVVVLPLLRNDDLIGIFEIFSSLPGAFSNGDLRTLEVLAERILRNAEARQSSLTAIKLPPDLLAAEGHAKETGEKRNDAASGSVGAEAAVYAPLTAQPATAAVRFEWLTTLMGGTLVAVALLMMIVFAMRMGWVKAGGQRRANRAANSAAASSKSSANTDKSVAVPLEGSISPQNKPAIGPSESQAGNAGVPEGSLRVYENGKEIFRLPSAKGNANQATGTNAKAGSELEPAKIVELTPGAAEGSLIRRVEPEYPQQALAQRIQGAVLLDVHISEEGAVQDANLLSGDPLLADAAIAAVRQWRFKPQMVNGHPVEMETKITLKFTLPPS